MGSFRFTTRQTTLGIKVLALVLLPLGVLGAAGIVYIARDLPLNQLAPLAVVGGALFLICCLQALSLVTTEEVEIQGSTLTIRRTSFLFSKTRSYEVAPGAVATVQRYATAHVGRGNQLGSAVSLRSVDGKDIRLAAGASLSDQELFARLITAALQS